MRELWDLPDHKHKLKLMSSWKMCHFCGRFKREKWYCTVKKCSHTQTKKIKCECKRKKR